MIRISGLQEQCQDYCRLPRLVFPETFEVLVARVVCRVDTWLEVSSIPLPNPTLYHQNGFYRANCEVRNKETFPGVSSDDSRKSSLEISMFS